MPGHGLTNTQDSHFTPALSPVAEDQGVDPDGGADADAVADTDSQKHGNAGPSTPGPQRANTGAKISTDKACPFCGRVYGSSGSLGGHLDKYIQPHNPKPPDGVHDVDEIRKIRSSVKRMGRGPFDRSMPFLRELGS